jgi:hypothetical protein
MTLDRPVFIVGTGRCGSTIFHKIFTHHPQVTFLSGLCLLYPNEPAYNRWAMRLMDVPLVGRYARKKFRPAEHWPFWDNYVRGFSFPCRDLLESDVRLCEVEPITRVLEQMLTPRRRRLLVKLTGWPRMGFLKRMFPGALFIHMVRDGRAVVNSLLNVDFWQGWGGPARLGLEPLSETERDEWELSGRSFVVLAAIQWKRWMDAYDAAKQELPAGCYLETTYESFTADPGGAFLDILKFCGMEQSAEFERRVRQFRVRSENDKWRQQLTAKQQQELTTSLQAHLERYGYELPSIRSALHGRAGHYEAAKS